MISERHNRSGLTDRVVEAVRESNDWPFTIERFVQADISQLGYLGNTMSLWNSPKVTGAMGGAT
jgi:hypothetical protein